MRLTCRCSTDESSEDFVLVFEGLALRLKCRELLRGHVLEICLVCDEERRLPWVRRDRQRAITLEMHVRDRMSFA